MTPERWQQIKKVFDAALERAMSERAAFLEQVCSGDNELQREVEELIAAFEQEGSFIETPAHHEAMMVIAVEDARSADMIGQVISHYRILSLLGKGGMGVVYAAEDIHLGRRVAIKLPTTRSDDHHFRSRFLREARSASALTHPHIATIYDYGEITDGQPFIVMELVDGPTLEDLVCADKLTLERAVEIIEQTAEALAEAHRHGIIHRDIKPSNIALTEQGIVKVLDFGLAKQLDDGVDSVVDLSSRKPCVTRTLSGVLIGTPLYFSPEQAIGAPVDRRSDLFALGALLYECVANRPAFSGIGVIDISAQVIHVDPPPPSHFNAGVVPEIDRITLKALAKKPDERYQSANELLADLRAIHTKLWRTDTKTKRLASSSDALHSSLTAFRTLSHALWRPRRPIPVLLAAIIIALLAYSGGVRLWYTRYEPSPRAVHWYKEGADALRDGAYYQASKALAEAVNVDGKFLLARARLAEAWTELDYTDRAQEEMLRVATLRRDQPALTATDELYLDAITAVVTRDFRRAIASYSELARLSADQPEVYVDLGRAYEKDEEIDKAIESYVKATEQHQQYATAFLRLGTLYTRRRDTESAADALNKAENIYAILNNLEGRTEVLLQRGILLREPGKLTEARAQYQRALEMAHTTGNESQRINTLLELSRLYTSEGATSKAEGYARQAIEFASGHGLENLAIGGLINLGRAFFVNGDDDEAEKYFKQSLTFARRTGARQREATSLMNLGSVYIQQRRTDEGLPYVEQAFAFFKQGGYGTSVSSCLTLLGRAKRQKGDYGAAIQLFQKKLQLAEQAGSQSQIAFSYGEIATVLAEQERYPEALSYYDRSYAINRTLSDRSITAYNLVNRGTMLWHLGSYEKADAALSQASVLANHPDGSYKPVLAEICMIKAQMELSKRRLHQAKEQSEQALKLASTQYTDIIVGAKGTLGLALALSREMHEGKRLCEEAVKLAQSSGDQTLLSKALLMLAEATLESGDAQGALPIAMQAQERFANMSQHESEWRACLVAARASRRKRDETTMHDQLLARTSDLLSQLQRTWGLEAFKSYIARPDVHSILTSNAVKL